MIIHSWDEISEEWATHELDIPTTTDPEAIHLALGRLLVGGNDGGDGYEVVGHTITGPIMTIECRDDRNHLAIIVVNQEQNLPS